MTTTEGVVCVTVKEWPQYTAKVTQKTLLYTQAFSHLISCLCSGGTQSFVLNVPLVETTLKFSEHSHLT